MQCDIPGRLKPKTSTHSNKAALQRLFCAPCLVDAKHLNSLVPVHKRLSLCQGCLKFKSLNKTDDIIT